MKNYISNGGYEFKNFNEVIDYMKNTNNSVSVKENRNFRAALLKNDGKYELRLFQIGKDFNAVWEMKYNLGERMTENKVRLVETVMSAMC